MGRRLRMMSWLLLAGSILFSAGCIGPRTVAQGVVAEGIEVGGMGYAEAAAKVREAIASALPPLIVQSPSETLIVRWPELSFSDDLPARLRSARRNERISVCVRRNWADAESRLLALCERNACAPQDARLTFSREGFSYSSGHTGRACSYQKLLSDVTEALRTGATQVTLRVRELMPAVTEEALRAQREGADCINIGPIYPTQTKEVGCEPLGLEAMKAILPYVNVPFSVMGGIKARHIPELVKAGARHIAMVTEITQARDVTAKVKSLRALFR